MRRKLFLALQVLFAGAVVLYAGRTIVSQIREARSTGLALALDWPRIVLSAVIVLATYALLIATWRTMVRSWGSAISWSDAARIWFVSNLGKYVPGKIWQLGAMAVMAKRAGVPSVVATGSSIVINLVNLLAGVGVVALTGAGLLGNPRVVVAAATLVGAGILLAPQLVPILARAASSMTGKSFEIPAIPQRPIWLAAVASLAAWLMYGVAFAIFAHGVTAAASGRVTLYVAAFTASYILGYVSLFVPGGLGVRDISLAAFLTELHLASAGAAVAIAVASRLWLTLLEVLPGGLYLVRSARRRDAVDSLGDASRN